MLVAAAPAHAATLPAASTALLSGAPSLFESLPAPVAQSASGTDAVSQDGQRVAFVSRSDGLLDGDDDRVANVYVKDLATGALTLVSRENGIAGEPSHDNCNEPAISDDGMRVAFACNGPLDAADTNDRTDVYVRSLADGSTILVSRASNLGAVGDDTSREPVLSATGEYVAFTSDADDLDPLVSSTSRVVYRRQIGATDQTVLISRHSAGDGGMPADGSEPSISDDGNRVAFTSATGTLSAADTNGDDDVYVRDHAAATTALASREAGAGAVGNGRSGAPALAGDGSAVAFASNATQFDFANDPEPGSDVYWRQLNGAVASQNTALVSINAAGNKGDNSHFPSIDDTGAVVGFTSRATGLDPADTDPTGDAYVKNVMTNTLEVVSRADGDAGAVANRGVRSVAISGDGLKAAVALEFGITPDAEPSQGTVILRDMGASPKRTLTVSRPPGTAPFLNEGGPSGNAAISADGRFAAFGTRAPALLPAGVIEGIVVRDRVTGAVELASRADGPGGAPFSGAVFDPAISADGQRVSFTAAPTLDGDASQNSVWVRDLDDDRTFLASRADAGAEANGHAFTSVLDADGSRVAFVSTATNLGDGDTDDMLDVHLRDLDADRTFLVSRADGAGSAKANGHSFDVDIDADGSRVSFVSTATNLGDGDTDTNSDAHLRDLATDRTLLVSAEPGGAKSDGDTSGTSLDASGTRVAFAPTSTNLGGVTTTGRKVFVRDFAADTLILASRADGADGAAPDVGAYSGAISPDGRYVAFESDSGNLGPAVPANTVQIYRRDLLEGRTELASRRTGAGGAPAAGTSLGPDVSSGGSCVTFSSDDELVGAPTDFDQPYIRAFDADCGDPPAGGDGPGGGGGGGVPGGGVPPDTIGPAADVLAPVLTAARLNRRRFRVGPKPTALTAAVRRGTVLTFRSSEAGTLTIVLQRRRKGRRVLVRGRTRCRVVRGRSARRRCVVHRTVGTLTRRIAAGPGRVALSGRIGRRRMRAGRYRMKLAVRDAAGNRSRTARLRFRVVRG